MQELDAAGVLARLREHYQLANRAKFDRLLPGDYRITFNRHLRRLTGRITYGMRLIEKAVQLKPDDGYIVDSLGWAHYKRGDFKEAVRYLERAVEIKPEDPTLNDHLGDAFWKVGREREARFQWNQALSLAPEPDDVEKIKAKIDRGLNAEGVAKNASKTRQVQSYEPSRRRSENKAQGRTVE